MSKSFSQRKKSIESAVQKLFGETPLEIQTPGGESRASCRVVLKDRTVIATKRPNFRRTRLEAEVLKALSPKCVHVPKFIGMHDDVLLQSDVGGQRLSQLIWQEDEDTRLQLAEKAVSAIFAIHRSARTALENVPVPPLGAAPAWIDGLLGATHVLQNFDSDRVQHIDRETLRAILVQSPKQFLKWDCRAGNAAISGDANLCWFDFEYCGMRHGAEDFAWLIGDESWPVDAKSMFGLVEAMLRDDGHPDVEGYMRYLAIYTTFHMLQRLALINAEVDKRGWRGMQKIIERDDVGRHPVFAAMLCKNAMYCASLSPLTAPLRRGFKRAASWHDKQALQLKMRSKKRAS